MFLMYWHATICLHAIHAENNLHRFVNADESLFAIIHAVILQLFLILSI